MIDGERIIYIHKKSGKIIEYDYLVDLLKNKNCKRISIFVDDDNKYILNDEREELTVYDYLISDVFISDDFDVIVVNNMSYYDYKEAILSIDLLNGGSYNLQKLKSILIEKSEEMKETNLWRM